MNDPVLLHVAKDRWWMQLADSDAGLYALGVAAAGGLDAQVSTPDVHPMQVQGRSAAKTLEKLVGPAIYDIKYYWIEEFDIGGIPVVISRTGWTAIPGFEVNLLDHTEGDRALGRASRRPARSSGSARSRRARGAASRPASSTTGLDIRLGDTPLHVMGLERLVEEQPQDYIGKAALEELRAKGVDRKLVGIELEGEELRAEMSEYWTVSSTGSRSVT